MNSSVLPDRPPVIVIGMHRTGSTMITHMLRKLGLFMGWLVQENAEAVFFVNRNEAILKACRGNWEHPEVLHHLLHDPTRKQAAVDLLRRDIASPRFLSFLGPRPRRGALAAPTWGWKDPRNTFLLPLWLECFPDAKIVHIFRNGVDVALSLSHREDAMEKERPAEPGSPARLLRHWRRESWPLFLARRLDSLRRVADPDRRYRGLALSPVMDPRVGFALWAAYTERAFSYESEIRNPMLHVKYETFLAGPIEGLQELAAFCSLPQDEQTLRGVADSVRLGRRFAFQQSGPGRALYEEVRSNPLMLRLGYDNV